MCKNDLKNPNKLTCWRRLFDNYEDRKCKLCDCVEILEYSYYNCKRKTIIKPRRSPIPSTLLFQQIMQIKPCTFTPPPKLTLYILKCVERIITTADPVLWYVFCKSTYTHCLWVPFFFCFHFPHLFYFLC